MLHHVSSKELETFVIPTKEHSIVLFSQLKSLNGLDSHGFNLLFCSLKLFVLLHRQLLLNLELVGQSLGLLLS